MAKYSKGILGPVSGKVGTVVGASWKSIHYFRSKPTKGNKSNTEAQKAQRGLFRINTRVAQALLPVGRVGLKALASRKTEYNIIMERLFAVKDTLEDLRLSTGVGPVVQGAALADDPVAKSAKVTWTPMAERTVHVAVIAEGKAYAESAAVEGAKGEHTFAHGRDGVKVRYAYLFSSDKQGGDVSDTVVVQSK